MRRSEQKLVPLGEVLATASDHAECYSASQAESKARNTKSNPSRLPYGRGYFALGLLVFSSFLGACGDSGAGGKANTDGSLDGMDAPVSLGSDGSDVLFPANLDVSNSDATPLADGEPPDVAPDSVAATGGPEGGTLDALAAEASGVQPAFACGSLGPLASDVSQRLCYDFSSASDSSNFTNEAGTWSVEDGTYHGVGPQDGQITCPGGPHAGSGMTTSVIATLSAVDVRVHARMTSWTNPDKVLVLRAQASGSRIEVNFRSYWGNQLALLIQSPATC